MIKGSSNLNLSKPTLLLGIVFVVSVVLAVGSLIKVAMDTADDRANLEIVTDLRAQSYRVTGLSSDATDGNEQAFTDLQALMGQMKAGWA